MSAFRCCLLLVSLSLLAGSGCRSLHLKEGARDYTPETPVAGDGSNNTSNVWNKPIDDPNRIGQNTVNPNDPYAKTSDADDKDKGLIPWPQDGDGGPPTMTSLATPLDDDNFGDINAKSGQYTVYFSYDKSDIGASERVKLDSLAQLLAASPNSRIVIQGHCDERGSEEYNRALGERRAIVVRDYLASVGVDQSRMETLSFGEEKPAEAGTTEAAYQMNRRAEFQILTPPGAGGR